MFLYPFKGHYQSTAGFMIANRFAYFEACKGYTIMCNKFKMDPSQHTRKEHTVTTTLYVHTALIYNLESRVMHHCQLPAFIREADR